MSTPSPAILTAPATTCAGASTTGCTYSGPDSGLFYRDGQKLCGACMDRADDEDMPYMVSEYSYRLLKAMDR